MKSDTTALHHWLPSPERRRGALGARGRPSWLNSAGSILKHKFSSFPLCHGLRRPLNKKKRPHPVDRARTDGDLLFFAHRVTRPQGQCLLISIAKEYVGYSGEEPSSPGHSVAAVTCEGKGECTGGLRNLRRALMSGKQVNSKRVLCS